MEAITYEQPEEHAEPPLTALPIAALFDGVPVQAHSLLSDRLIIDDPNDLESRVVVAFRRHGTAMASLILHGDLNAEDDPLPRPLYVRPILSSSNGESEHSDADRLLIDVIHTAVTRMKGDGGLAGMPRVCF